MFVDPLAGLASRRLTALVVLLAGFAWQLSSGADALADSRNSDDPARIQVIRSSTPPLRRLVDQEPQSVWRYRVIEISFAGFAFIIGACVGSFLNVVIYRLPLGMGLLRADSHCPVCGMPIAITDNVPIIGWLKLHGRCRECAVRISPRYMYVETGTALIFLMLAWTELFSGGSNLPGGVVASHSLWNLARIDGELIALCLYHGFLCSALLCSVLIDADGFDLPRTLILPTLMVGLLFPFRIDAGLPLPEGLTGGFVIEAVIGMGVGGIVGAVLGIGELYGDHGRRRWRTMTIVLAVIGCYLGWDSAIFVAAVACLTMLIVALVGDRIPALQQIPLTTYPAAAAVLQIPFWRHLTASSWWPRWDGGGLKLFWFLMAFCLLALVVRRVRTVDEELKYGAAT